MAVIQEEQFSKSTNQKMEDIPPSYNNINPNVLDLLPPYINTASLVNLCLVSRKYYAIFIPHLWGSPASHFVEVANESSRTTNGINFANLQVTGSQNDMVYVALTRFKRILRKARLSTRQLCHTLHLPPALSEIYGGPNSTWLREVLDWLPALQSLCVSALPFFDHESLLAVDQTRNSSVNPDTNDDSFRRYPVKLLLAAKEPNVTSLGLSLLMPHLPDLVYLDLSYTTQARKVYVLQSLDALVHLQVLKLRGIGLRDKELEVLSKTIGLRVRLLDIAENRFSDIGVRCLLQSCLWLPSMRTSNGAMPNDRYSRAQFESWPVGLPPPPDSLSLDTIRNVELDEALLNQLTNPLTGRLAFEDIPHGGVTHLYISGNPRVSVEGVRSLLELGRLHVLDAGDVGALVLADLQWAVARLGSEADQGSQGLDGSSSYVRQQFADDTRHMVRLTKQALASNFKGLINRNRSRSTATNGSHSNLSLADQQDDESLPLFMPGAEKLVPVLREKASKNLTHLRIDHTVATAILDIKREPVEQERKIANMSELPGSMSLAAELDAVNRQVQEAPGSRVYAAEMPSGSAVFEMDAAPATPRAELPGDIIHFAFSLPVGEAPGDHMEDDSYPIRAEGALAPEVVGSPKEGTPSSGLEEEVVVLTATGSGTTQTSGNREELNTKDPTPNGSLTSSVERPAPLQIHKKSSSASSNYAKEIESLTKLRPQAPVVKLHPSFLPNLRTLILTNVPPRVPANSTLIHNLKEFIVDCSAEARLAILKARTNYSLPPGRARQDAERQHARTLFALSTIVLEIDPEPERGSQRGWKQTGQRFNISKSSTGDMDSEALWSAAENDFSFFGEEGEEATECGIYDQEPSKYFPTIPFDEKITISPDDQYDGYNSAPGTPLYRISSPTISNYGSHGSSLTPTTPIARHTTIMQSPRNLPLGRNRRTSNELQRVRPASPEARLPPRSQPVEMPGIIPAARVCQPANPTFHREEPPPTLDVVSELARWRRERKDAYLQAVRSREQTAYAGGSGGATGLRLAELDVYVEGYWAGEIKVVRNSKQAVKGKLERTGNVDIYGNYFEGGYLYP